MGLGAARLQSAMARVAQLQARLLALQAILREAGQQDLDLVGAGDGVDGVTFLPALLRGLGSRALEEAECEGESPPWRDKNGFIILVAICGLYAIAVILVNVLFLRRPKDGAATAKADF